MERSSPLAAMQAPSFPFGQWGCRADASSYTSCGGQFGGKAAIGPSNFNFKDLSMSMAPSDYFNLKPIRGSSPTASLAAHLSQNFHIDQSPQLPTPRRSLFSANLFASINGRESVTTPPLPSSSPGPYNESMEISPLPHKAPYASTTQLRIQSPTPEPTIIDQGIPGPMVDVQQQLSDAPRQSIPFERRRSTLLRPSLARSKGHTTSSVSLSSARAENQLPPFKFGNGLPLPTASFMPADECFNSSPPQERRPQSANSPLPSAMGPPRLKQPFLGLVGHMRNSGSPITSHVRRPSGPTQRPRKQFRRSLSMFEHPAYMMKEESIGSSRLATLDAIMDIDDVPQLQLPHFIPDEESLPRITKETIIEVLNGKFQHCYHQAIVVDCRFEYEYDGGHIEGAVNVNSKEELAKKLFDTRLSEKTLLIFHCEYSAHRAPLMAKFLRHKDRAENAHRYPKLSYPEVYILDGGYSSFFSDHRVRCVPQDYVEMDAKEHVTACERGLGRMKQQRVKLSRAQTFAFGQHNQPIDDSPTAPNRHCPSLTMGMDISIDRHLDPATRSLSRRMASY